MHSKIHMVVIETIHWMFTILCVILLPWKRYFAQWKQTVAMLCCCHDYQVTVLCAWTYLYSTCLAENQKYSLLLGKPIRMEFLCDANMTS